MAEPAPTQRSSPTVPPWLWLWSLFLALSIPRVMATWQGSLQGLGLLAQSVARLRALDPSYERLGFLLYPSVLQDVLPTLALLVGLTTVLLPWVREAYVEKRFRLRPITALPPPSPAEPAASRHGLRHPPPKGPA